MPTAIAHAVQRSRLSTAFWLFWVGEGLSALGNNVTTLAFPLVGVLVLHASAAQMGVLIAAGQIPNLVTGMLSGPFIDRYSRRRVLLVTDYGSAVLLGAVPLLAWLGVLSLPLLAAIAFCTGTLAATYDVTCMALVPDLVAEDRLLWTNTCFEATNSAAQVAGPGIAGAAVSAIGAARTLLLDVVSFLISALMLHLIRRDTKVNLEAPAVSPSGGYLRQLREGGAAVWRDPRLRLLGLGSGGFNLFGGIMLAVEVLYALHVVGLSPAQLGFTTSAGLLGAVAAALIVGWLNRRLGAPAVLALGLLCAAPAPLLMLAAAGGARWAAPPLFGAGLFLDSLSVTLFTITNLGVRQAIIPAAIRGRVFASMRVLSRGGIPLGALLGGIAAADTSLGTALFLTFAGKLIIGCVFAVKRGRLVASPDSAKGARIDGDNANAEGNRTGSD